MRNNTQQLIFITSGVGGIGEYTYDLVSTILGTASPIALTDESNEQLALRLNGYMSLTFRKWCALHVKQLAVTPIEQQFGVRNYRALCSFRVAIKTVTQYESLPTRSIVCKKKRIEKTEETIKNGQSSNAGNIGYTRHRTKTNRRKNTTPKTNMMSNKTGGEPR